MTAKEKKEMEVSAKKSIEPGSGEPTREGIVYAPDVNIVEDKEAYTLWADLPGVSKDQLTIDVRDNTLTITGATSAINERLHLLHREYEVGGFTRQFTLGEKIDQGKIGAAMKNGVLTLVLPKAEPHKPRKITIS